MGRIYDVRERKQRRPAFLLLRATVMSLLQKYLTTQRVGIYAQPTIQWAIDHFSFAVIPFIKISTCCCTTSTMIGIERTYIV